MLYGITWENAVALAIVVILSGFIAYLGDLLGRRMGKRRLNLFGLRPRYTAIAVTTITGMLIAALTMCIMAGVSQRVRLLFQKGLEIVSENTRMQHQLHATHKQLSREQLALDHARRDAVSAKKSRDQIIAERDKLTQSLTVLKADLLKSGQELTAAQNSLKSAKGDLSSARKEIADHKAEIKREQLAISDLERRREILQAEDRQLLYHLSQMLTGKITLRPGDEVAREVISCSASKAEIRRQVFALISSADRRAKEAGCAVGENGRAVELVPMGLNPKQIEQYGKR
jgi:uncharacterized protein (DUF3084 family)